MLQNDPSSKDELPEICAKSSEFDKYCVLSGDLLFYEGRMVERHP